MTVMEKKTYTELQQLSMRPAYEDSHVHTSGWNLHSAWTQQRKLHRRLSRQQSRKQESPENINYEDFDGSAYCGIVEVMGIKETRLYDDDMNPCSYGNRRLTYLETLNNNSNCTDSENLSSDAGEPRAEMEMFGFKYDFDPGADLNIYNFTNPGFHRYPDTSKSSVSVLRHHNVSEQSSTHINTSQFHGTGTMKQIPMQRQFSRQKQRKLQRGCRLWEFIRDLLNNPLYNPSHIKWLDKQIGEFRLIKSNQIARMWGEKKNNDCMTYEKLSRAMRYYYKRGILTPVLGKRLVYRFGEKSHGWK